MSRKAIKLTALVLAIIMTAGLFGACGKDTATSDSAVDSAVSTTASTASEAKAEPVTIDWLAYDTYGQPDPEAEVIKQQEKWYNIKFNFWYIDDQQWDQVLGVKLASGDMPDVLKIKNTGMVTKYVNQGVLAPITDEMQAKVPALMKAIDNYGGRDQLVDGMVDGKLYVLKNVNLSAAYPTVLVWRTDWLKNVGIGKIPETIAEWEDALYKLRNNDPDKNNKKDTYGMSNNAMNAVFGAFGAIPLKEFRGKGTQNLFWTKKDDKYVFAATQTEAKDALTLLAKWYKDGIIDPEFVTGENTAGYWATSQAFENGKVGVTGMAMATHWNPPLAEGMNPGPCYDQFLKVNPNAKLGEPFDIGKPPVGPAGKSGTHTWGAIQTAGCGFTTKLTSDPKKVDAVFNMLNILSTDYDKYIYARHGIKDVDYTIDANGLIIGIEGKYTEAGSGQKAGISVLNYFSPPEFLKKSSPLNFEWADKYKSTGYADLLVPQTDTAAKYTEDLKKLALDAYVAIITGAKPVSYFDEFTKTFYANGGSEIEQQVNDATSKAAKK